MSQKKIIYDIDGKVKESSQNYYDDSSDNIIIKNVSFNSASVNLQNGMVYVNNTLMTSSDVPKNNSIITWNSTTNQWVSQPNDVVDVVATNASIPASSDITGSFTGGIRVKALSNVNIGDALAVSRGGTGLKAIDIPNGESLLIGNNSSKFTFITASGVQNNSVLLSTTNNWSYATQSYSNMIIDISIFTSSVNWVKPAGTKFIRVLAQGGGGGGGSGANRNNTYSAIGGSGGGAGGFVDSGVFLLSDNSASIVVGAGGAGAIYPSSGSAGISGVDGGSSSFGTYIYANGGNGGFGGTLNSATTISGGAAVSYGTNIIYDTGFFDDSSPATDAGEAGGNATSTVGSSTTFTLSPTVYYGVGSGGGGGALPSANYTTNYAGGNGGNLIFNSGSTSSINARNAISSSVLSLIETNVSTDSQTNDIFLTSGGGGGASAAVPQSLVDVLALTHANLDAPVKDNSVYNYSVLSSSFMRVISTASVGIPPINSLFTDGIISSSAGNGVSTGQSSYSVIPTLLPSGNFSIESFFYLKNTGSVSNDADFRCMLLNVGFMQQAGSVGTLLGVSSTGKLNIWSNNARIANGSGSVVPLNQWVHLLLQKSGSNLEAYINGVKTITTASVPTISQYCYGYSAGLSNTAAMNPYNFNGYAKDLRVLNRAQSASEIASTYSGALVNLNTGSFTNPPAISSYAGGVGGNGAWGSGGGGGGASTNAISNLTQYDIDTLSLSHFNISDGQPKDSAIYNSTVYVGSINKIVSTASMGSVLPINNVFSDGYFSSSAYPGNPLTGYHSYTISSFSTTNFSMESWFHLQNFNANNSDATWKYCLLGGGRTSTASTGLQLWVQNTGQMVLFNGNTGGVFNTGLYMTGSNLNKWNHMVLELNGTTGNFYMNGQLAYTTTVGTCTPTGEWGYGYSKDYPIYNFNGYAKELRLLNRIQTPTEILNNYNAVMSGNQGSYSDHNGVQQGGNGGDGYVAVISYKY